MEAVAADTIVVVACSTEEDCGVLELETFSLFGEPILSIPSYDTAYYW